MAEPAQQQPPPANEPETDDDRSAVGDTSEEESLASLRSSIIDYRKENGRTYHKLSDGKYYLPNDELEWDRLDLAHQLWLLTYDGELCNNPKKDGAKRVLDIGTGTGAWAMDFADAHPEATVIGVDLSAIQPGYVPPNCHFELDDVDKDWTWSQPFDFVFIRSMVGSFGNWPDIIEKSFDKLEVGGYLEIQDNLFPVACDDDSMPEDSKILKWTKLIIEGSDKTGQVVTVAPKFKSMMEEAGFVDVEVRMDKWPVGPWPTDPKLKELGRWCRSCIIRGIEGLSLAVFTRLLDWTKDETLVFCSEVRAEAKRTDIRNYFPVYSVWGRKPEQPEQPESP